MAAKKRVASWEVTDDFWARVEPLVPVRECPPDQQYMCKAGAGRKPNAALVCIGNAATIGNGHDIGVDAG